MKISKSKFRSFYALYDKAKTEPEQYALLKDFTLSLSLDELLAWTDFADKKWTKQFNKTIKKGLTQEDKLWFEQQFAKFDELAKSWKNAPAPTA
jgi:hypothetical protein